MKTTITKTLLITIFVLLSGIKSFAYDFELNGIYYNILSENNKTVEVTFFSPNWSDNRDIYCGNIQIPDTLNYNSESYTVVAVGNEAFKSQRNLVSVTIPNSVTEIGFFAFYDCQRLLSITIPNSVIEIGYGAFDGCTSLTDVTLPDNMTTLKEGTFAGCKSLKSIKIPDKVTYIGNGAFSGCDKLKTINIPSLVSEIDRDPFNCSELSYIFVEDNNRYYCSIDGILYNKDVSTLIRCPPSHDEYNPLITIPSSVAKIGENAFSSCCLAYAFIPNSVIEIGDEAFFNCSLESVVIPNSVTKIGRAAFHECNHLLSATISNSVTSIGQGNFQACHKMINIFVDADNQYYSSIDGVLYNKDASILIVCPEGKISVTIPNSATEIGPQAFSACENLTSVTIPNSVISIGRYAFSGCYNLTSIKIPSYVTEIGDYAFSGCKGLTSVIIPNSVKNIGTGVFYGCSKLASVAIQNAVIGIGAFSECSNLTFVTISDSVTVISNNAFRNCVSLTTAQIPNSVTEISDYAFSGCKGLTSVTIPNSVTSISWWCFSMCYNLTSVYCKATTPPQCSHIKAFEESAYQGTLYVPTGTKGAYEVAPVWCEFKNIVEMDFSGIEEVKSRSAVGVRTQDGSIFIEGADDGTRIEVFDTAGKTIYSGYEKIIPVNVKGIYLVKVNNTVNKIKL